MKTFSLKVRGKNCLVMEMTSCKVNIHDPHWCSICGEEIQNGANIYLLINNQFLFPNAIVHTACVSDEYLDLEACIHSLAQKYDAGTKSNERDARKCIAKLDAMLISATGEEIEKITTLRARLFALIETIYSNEFQTKHTMFSRTDKKWDPVHALLDEAEDFTA